MKTLTIFFEDPVLIIIAILLAFVFVILIGRPIALWFYKIEDQIKILNEIKELQKEQLKFFKDKFGEPQPEKADPDFKKVFDEQQSIQTAKADPEFKKWLDEQKNTQNP